MIWTETIVYIYLYLVITINENIGDSFDDWLCECECECVYMSVCVSECECECMYMSVCVSKYNKDEWGFDLKRRLHVWIVGTALVKDLFIHMTVDPL